MVSRRVVVVGGGVGGLVTAALLAGAGLDITVLERSAAVGGKMRQVRVGPLAIDAGPTVMTMRWVFEDIFDTLGTRLDKHLNLLPAGLLARHAWPLAEGSPTLDLFADIERSADAIGAFAGPAEAQGYRRFCAYARRIFEAVDLPFLRAERPGLGSAFTLARQKGLSALLHLDGMRTVSRSLADFFRDPRLVQLFGRYATYCGSSPYLAPATLNVIAHVEREGVWLVDGGMYKVAEALAGLVTAAGGTIRCGAEVREITVDRGRASGVLLASGERIDADAIVLNADAEALARGLFGERVARAGTMPRTRSLSALTWAIAAKTSGFPLVRHNVFFSQDYPAEFHELFDRDEVPIEPTVYLCAQDRDDEGRLAPGARADRMLVLVNAPSNGDRASLSPSEMHRCQTRSFALLRRSGLQLDPLTDPPVTTAPADFERLFPGTGGALYGPASHGAAASFTRATSRTKIPRLYMAGGSAHPGAGVPMAALSGKLAASSVLADLASIRRSKAAATSGGISTR
ncbi:MAG: phytoene desaturase family protein [Byssovorax sp.]